jgi:FkbM family methyltransferase
VARTNRPPCLNSDTKVDFNYTKIKLGNWLFKNAFPFYNVLYTRFKLRNDRDEIEILTKVVQEGSSVLDIGANIGFYAKVLSRLTGNTGRVYCFEPDSVNFRYLKKNTAGLSNVTLFHKAVSSGNGTLKVYRSKLLNVDHRTYPVNNYDSVEEIQAVSIDQLLRSEVIARVDVIKIDIQGYELEAFKGMKQLLTGSDHLKILAEYWPHGFKRAGTSAVEFFDFFDGLGYGFSVIERGALKPLVREYVVMHNDEAFEFSFNVLVQKKKRDHAIPL